MSISRMLLTFLRLPVELLSQIFAFHFLTGFKYIDALSRVSTQIRLVCRLWDAVIISTPSLWVQLRFDQNYSSRPVRPRIPPDILSIWLQRSKTYPLHIELDCHKIDPQCFPVLTNSIERWESLVLHVFSISSVNTFPFLVPDDLNSFVFPSHYWRHQILSLHS